jgi:hypothetical protein
MGATIAALRFRPVPQTLDARRAFVHDGAMTQTDSDLEAAILQLAQARGPDKSICPSEAAKHVAAVRGTDWHTLMQPARRAAVGLALAGRLVILRKGKPVDPADFRGVYRLTVPRED